MAEKISWTRKFGFESPKDYTDYMSKHGLWGSDDYVRSKSSEDKILKRVDG